MEEQNKQSFGRRSTREVSHHYHKIEMGKGRRGTPKSRPVVSDAIKTIFYCGSGNQKPERKERLGD